MPKLKERLTFPDGTTQSTAALPLSSSLPGSDTQAGAVGTEAASAHGDHRHPKGRTATAADPVAYAITTAPTVDRAQHYLSDPSTGVPAVYNIRGVRDAGDPTLAGDTTIFLADSFGNQVSLDETGLSLQDLNGNVISGTGSGWAFTPALPIPALSNSNPLGDSASAAPGTSGATSRADHQHPKEAVAFTDLSDSAGAYSGHAAQAVVVNGGETGLTYAGLLGLSSATPLIESGAGSIGTAPTAAHGDHVHPAAPTLALSSATPLVESGAGSAGTGTDASRADHVHPSAGLTNPMTTQDDLIIGGAGGTPARLGKGSDGYVLTVDPTTHHLVWAAAPSGFTDPTTTKGDLIVHGASTTRLPVGTDGQTLQADSSTSAGVVWTAYPEAHPWTAGTYLYPLCNSGQNSRVLNDLFLQPMVIWQTVAVDQILIEVTTLGVTTNARLGIYATGTDGYPGALLLDAGTVAVTSTGVKSITISQTFQPGLYWLAAVAQGTNQPAFRTNNGHLPGVQADQIRAFTPLTSGLTGYKVAGISGALPDPLIGTRTIDASTTRVCLRVA